MFIDISYHVCGFHFFTKLQLFLCYLIYTNLTQRKDLIFVFLNVYVNSKTIGRFLKFFHQENDPL